MPPREAFDPFAPKQHVTSKQGRREYLKRQRLNAGPSPAQVRAAQARLEASQRAQDLRDKEQKAKVAKQKRVDKERKEREAKEALVAQGKLKPEDLLPKVRSSQPRLNSFFAKPAPPQKAIVDKEAQILNPEPEDQCEEETVGTTPRAEDPVSGSQQTVNLDGQSDCDLDEIFASISPFKSLRGEQVADQAHNHLLHEAPQTSRKARSSPPMCPMSTQEEVDAQLSSEAMYDLGSSVDVFEDITAHPLDSTSISSSQLRKRKAREFDDYQESPSPSKRPVLSQMSPSKVNVRAQERPNPMDAIQNSGTPAPDLFDGLCTQDLAFSLEDDESSEKENATPLVHPKSSLPSTNNKKDSQSTRSKTNSFEQALRAMSSSPLKQVQNKDSETDYGGSDIAEEDLDDNDILLDDHSWIDKAVLEDLPPTPSKSRMTKPSPLPSDLKQEPPKTRDNNATRPSISADPVINTSFSALLDDADLLEALNAAERSLSQSPSKTPKKKGRRRIPWIDGTSSQKGSTGNTPAKQAVFGEGVGFDALEQLASSFDEEF